MSHQHCIRTWFCEGKTWYEYEPKSDLENGKSQIMWDVKTRTDQEIMARRPGRPNRKHKRACKHLIKGWTLMLEMKGKCSANVQWEKESSPKGLNKSFTSIRVNMSTKLAKNSIQDTAHLLKDVLEWKKSKFFWEICLLWRGNWKGLVNARCLCIRELVFNLGRS